MEKGAILIVDDNEDDRVLLERPLRKAGYQVRMVESAHQALEAYASERPDLCITDQAMPGMDGVSLVGELRRRDPTAQVIMLTGHGSIDRAVEAMRAGAIDFLTKPVDQAVLLARIDKALALEEVLTENRNLREEIRRRFDFSSLVAESEQMKRVLALAEQAAQHEVTVLITGESGVGKEVLARAIHYNSRRSTGRFFALNCAAIAENLVESELFGHEKGAFTGADRKKEGLLEQAARGTLLLDEIGDLPLPVQAKFLRVIDAREMIRVGGTQPLRVDARLIAATNAELRDLVEARKFREDLYFRLNVFAIHIPPLRERREDILPLARHSLSRLAREMGKEPPSFSADAIHHMLSASWPGNVRELSNAIERAVIVCREAVITAADFPPDPRAGRNPPAPAPAAVPVPSANVHDIRRAAEQMERDALLKALAEARNNLSEAARRLGIGRGALRYRLERLGIVSKDRL
jgi:two-component system NtrC family response regulator